MISRRSVICKRDSQSVCLDRLLKGIPKDFLEVATPGGQDLEIVLRPKRKLTVGDRYRFKKYEAEKNTQVECERRRERHVEYTIVYPGAHGKTMMQRELSRRQLLACLAEESEDELAYAIRDLIIESIATSPFKKGYADQLCTFLKRNARVRQNSIGSACGMGDQLQYKRLAG